MTNTPDSPQVASRPMIYQIRLQGQLDPEWSEWFEELTIRPQDNGDTLLTGPVTDQAALHGLLKKVRDLGITLLSVNQVEACNEDNPKWELK